MSKELLDSNNIIFAGQHRPRNTWISEFKADVPEDLKEKIRETLQLFYQEKPIKVSIERIKIIVEHDS